MAHAVKAFPALLALVLLLTGTTARAGISSELDMAQRGILKYLTDTIPRLLQLWTDPNYCNWKGITCDTDGRIITFSLPLTDVEGEMLDNIPKDIGSVLQLQELHFENMYQITGTLPASLANFRSLTYLSVIGTKLEGTIPREWGSMPNLKRLVLTDTPACGSLPAWGADSKLERIEIGGTKNTGPLPSSWASIPNLKAVQILNTKVCGCMPDSWRNHKVLGSTETFEPDVRAALTSPSCAVDNACSGSSSCPSSSTRGALYGGVVAAAAAVGLWFV